MKIKISVVVPTYNRPHLLQKCLLNVVNQSFDKNEYEVIIISDGPDERTKEAVEEYNKSQVEISYHSLPLKQGPAAARNLGWQTAKGTLIAFTDDDCVPDENWLKEIWSFYQHQDSVAYTGRVIVPISKHPTDFELNTARLETAEFVTANCICTKQALIKVHGFDERFKAAWREDSDLHFKLLVNNIPIIKNNLAIVHHPVRAVQWGFSIKDQKKSLYNALLYKKFPELFRRRIKQQPNWNYYAIIVLFATAITTLLEDYNKISFIAFSGWLVLTGLFIAKRLKHSSRSFNHLSEMIVTSLVIPFLSVFWTLYGAFKYRVLFF